MSKPDHERIWLEPRPGDPNEGREWCTSDAWSDNPDYADDGPATEYIRADLAEAECRMLSAQVAALDAKLAELSEWHPIETAPKDGTEILLLGVRGAREVAIWLPKGNSWADENGNACAAGYGTIQKIGCWLAGGGWFQPNEVRGWLPLPPAPKEGL